MSLSNFGNFFRYYLYIFLLSYSSFSPRCQCMSDLFTMTHISYTFSCTFYSFLLCVLQFGYFPVSISSSLILLPVVPADKIHQFIKFLILVIISFRANISNFTLFYRSQFFNYIIYIFSLCILVIIIVKSIYDHSNLLLSIVYFWFWVSVI